MDTNEAILKRDHRDDASSSQSKKKMKTEENESIDDDQDSITDESNRTTKSEMESSRRAKRLAMNRMSARRRRQRAKTLICTLQEEVNELTQLKKSMELEKNEIKEKLRATEQELDKAKAILANCAMKQPQHQRDKERSGGTMTSSSSDFSLKSLLSHHSQRRMNSTTDTPLRNISERTNDFIHDLFDSQQQQRNIQQVYDTHAALAQARETMLLSSSSNREFTNRICPMDLKQRFMTEDSMTTPAPPRLPSGGTTNVNRLDRTLLEGATAHKKMILNDLLNRKQQEYLLEKHLERKWLLQQLR
jgi:hypothetical protein